MKALTLELPFTHIHTHTHTAWSAAQTPQTHCRRNPIDRDHHVSIADGHRVKGIMWNQSRQQRRSFTDSAGISPLKSNGLGFGTPELWLVTILI